ncbi:MAG TPA: tetratricopeptide repeat protein, partial [Tepidisphaeraceae bacterium]
MAHEDIQLAVERAQKLHAAGNFRDAELSYRAVLAQQPGHVSAMHLLGLLLFQQGRRPEGLQLIVRSVQLSPDNAALHFNY